MSWQRLFENPTQRYELQGNDAIFRLKDYLTPGGRYPYEDLPKDMSAAFRAGLGVYLYSVPGHLMVSAMRMVKTKTPWCVGAASGRRMKCFRTVAEALRW